MNKHDRYNRSEKGRARNSRYERTEKGRARDRKRRTSERYLRDRVALLLRRRAEITNQLEDLDGTE